MRRLGRTSQSVSPSVGHHPALQGDFATEAERQNKCTGFHRAWAANGAVMCWISGRNTTVEHMVPYITVWPHWNTASQWWCLLQISRIRLPNGVVTSVYLMWFDLCSDYGSMCINVNMRDLLATNRTINARSHQAFNFVLETIQIILGVYVARTERSHY